jgi:hypothetical protein
MFFPVTGIEQIKPVTPQPPSSSVFRLKGGTCLQISTRDRVIFSTLSIINSSIARLKAED